ncbi:ATP-grasp fold amidoligase family protein [Aeromonas caviae]|uniref:ATP-grasp fold amidoligase family protein n=1 Tax=Aeromonas caviae TaxID=648 RepID=UPI003444786F
MKMLKYFIRDSIRYLLGKKGYTILRFIITHKYIPNFNKPRTFSEKIICRKFDDKSIVFSKYVDKFAVRSIVDNSLGQKYLIPLIKSCKYIKPSDFDDLPNQFVIKTSNGGGGENVLIVDDKTTLNIQDVCNKFNSYLKMKMGTIVDESFYDIEPPRVIFEKLIKHQDGSSPSDYKIHVFNSNDSSMAFIQVDADRFSNHKRSIYNEDLSLAGFNIQPKYEPINSNYSFPANINELIFLAKKLSDGFKYVRIDMYSVDDEIYFGEMTFCHGSGWEPISPKSADFMLGSIWDEYH